VIGTNNELELIPGRHLRELLFFVATLTLSPFLLLDPHKVASPAILVTQTYLNYLKLLLTPNILPYLFG